MRSRTVIGAAGDGDIKDTDTDTGILECTAMATDRITAIMAMGWERTPTTTDITTTAAMAATTTDGTPETNLTTDGTLTATDTARR
mmetsp:Transcript_12473/g.24303  ORF Transcript_12473/g.24303 Transcript_12473/m.24303 type:complete len:86 (-) Transcript_12473:711-968(-)